MKADDVEVEFEIRTLNGRPNNAIIQSNVKCSDKVLRRDGHALSRKRGTSSLTRIWCPPAMNTLRIEVGPGFFAGRKPTEEQVRHRAAKAVWELIASINAEQLAVDLTLEKLAEGGLQTLIPTLRDGSEEAHSMLLKNTRRMLRLISNLIHLANALKGE